jgi:phosphohistidine swiveling domain-containing protein
MWRAIRRVFLEVWDPIRISDEPNAQDEYDGYIGGVFELLVNGGTDREIVEYLDWAVGRMGMDGSRASFADVIAALRQIPIPNR